jgi:hypothetical protein
MVNYEWGKVLNFGHRGNGLAYCGAGWGDGEDGFVWSNSYNSRLSMSVSPPGSDVSLFLNVVPFIAEGKVEEQQVHVFVNFLRIGFATLSSQAELSFDIPMGAFTRSRCDVDLYMPQATSPFKLGLSPDIRCLGLALSRMIMVQI